MPFDSGGLFSLVPSYKATTGQTIRTEQHNPPLEDIANAMSSVLVRDGRAGMVGNLSMGGFKVTSMGDGSDATDGATVGQVLAAAPIGCVIDFAGSSAPSGWFLCYGQAISRTTYAALFAVIGTTYGTGDGSTTFNLPDARGRVIAGKDNMGGTSANRLTAQTGGVNGDNLGASGGSETHVLTAAQLAAHTHTGTTSSSGAHTHTVAIENAPNVGGGGASRMAQGGSTNTSSAGAHTHSFTTSSVGSDAAHNNVQPVLILNKIIRAVA